MNTSLSKLLETPTTVIDAKEPDLEPTKPWEPEVTSNGDGTYSAAVVSSAGADEGPGKLHRSDQDLLREAGFDPACYAIDSRKGIQRKQWDALRRVWTPSNEPDNPDGGRFETRVEKLEGCRFTVVERPQRVDLGDIESIIREGVASRPKGTSRGGGSLLFGLGDYQVGKLENPLEGLLGRVEEVLRVAIQEANTRQVDDIVIAWTGDLTEGFVSQGGRNAWRTTFTITEQVRIVRRMMLMVIDAFIDAGYPRITAISVPGNHDEAMRQPVGTRADDSWAVDALVALAEGLELNPARYGQVKCYVPGKDEIGVTLNIEGVNFGFIHGDQFRANQHWKWWEGQSLGRTPYGLCDVMICGHWHHTHIEERGDRTFAIAPALESNSQWWSSRTGQIGNPGALVAHVNNGVMLSLHKISALYRTDDERKVTTHVRARTSH